MPFESVAASLRATPEEIDAHYEQVNPELSRWAHLEFSRSVAERNVKSLLATLDAERTPEVKELLAILISLGAFYIAQLEQLKDGIPFQATADFARAEDNAAWGLKTMRFVYEDTGSYNPADSPKTWKETAIQLLGNATEFFKSIKQ